RRGWSAGEKNLGGAGTAFCGGSAGKGEGVNLDVIQHRRLGGRAAPAGVPVNPGAAPGAGGGPGGKGIAIHGCGGERAPEPTISPSVPSTRPKFVLDGLPSLANVSFRVAAIDPASATGQSPWSAWVVGNAR